MKYGVNRQILLITAGTVWIIAGANILRNRNCNLVKHLPRLDVQNRRSYRRFSCYSSFWCSEDFIINIPNESTKERTQKLPVLLFRCEKLDYNDLHDFSGNYYT